MSQLPAIDIKGPIAKKVDQSPLSMFRSRRANNQNNSGISQGKIKVISKTSTVLADTFRSRVAAREWNDGDGSQTLRIQAAWDGQDRRC
jgi:hypothetical protein